MTKLHYGWNDLEKDINHLALKVALSGWLPDIVVGISRGGCVPAVMLSHRLGVPMNPLHVSLRDHEDSVSDCSLSEAAYGWGMDQPQNILIVDDINDSGATFQWIMDDWQSSCLPDDERWKSVWNQNVRFLTLFNNESSTFTKVDYAAQNINKMERDVYIVFPWEYSQD